MKFTLEHLAIKEGDVLTLNEGDRIINVEWDGAFGITHVDVARYVAD